MFNNRVVICGVDTSKIPVLKEKEKVELLKKIKEGDMKAILNMKIDMLTTDYPLHARYLMKRMGIQEIDANK